MAKYVATIKPGNNGASLSVRDVETGEVGSVTFMGPIQLVQQLIKRSIQASPDFEVKYE